MRTIRCLVAAVLAGLIVTVVAAQQPGGGRGGAQDVNTLVFTNAALQEELKVTDAQKAKFKPVAEKLAEVEKSRPAFGKGGDKEKTAAWFEKSKAASEEAKKIGDDTLTAEQKKRLHQIAIQAMSFRVFNDPEAKGTGGKGGGGGFTTDAQKAIMKEVGDAVKLTDKQKSTVKGVADEYNKESQAIRTEAGIGFGKTADPEKEAAAKKKVDKLRQDAWAKVEESLDATQKTAWKGLVGEAFDTSKLRTVAPKKD